MKRFAIIISVVALALACFGCASNSQSGTGQSSASDGSSATDTTVTVSEDLLGVTNPVSEPPIACTKKVDYQNVSLMIPEEWEAGEGVGEYLKIWVGEGDEIAGSLQIQQSDLNANNTDEELLVLANGSREQQLQNGFTLEETFTVNRKGNLAYIIIPFSATMQNSEGKDQEFWGYSYCGYDNEQITADLSSTKDDKDILETFRWIFENIQVNE